MGMFWFVSSVILLVVGLLFLLASRRAKMVIRLKGEDLYGPAKKRQEGREAIFGLVAVAALVIGAVTLLLNTFTIVSPRHVGIPVSLGTVGDPLDSGFHPVAPWSDITEVDTTVQNINLDADIMAWLNSNVCTAVTVRLASGATACVNITSQWNVADDVQEASTLWSSYRGNTNDQDPTNDNFIVNLRNNVVDREIQRAMNKAFATYNPIVVGNDGQVVNTPLDLSTYSETVRNDLIGAMDKGVNVGEFLITIVYYDKVTQEKINGLAQAKADTQIAIQNKLTAEQQKLANDLLAAASSSDPGVMFQNCINLIKDLAAKDQLKNLPPAWTCAGASQAQLLVQDTRGQQS